MEEQIGKVRVMFSKRSWSVPELEDNMGQSHFSALESHVVTQQDSGLSSMRESDWEGGICALWADRVWGRGGHSGDTWDTWTKCGVKQTPPQQPGGPLPLCFSLASFIFYSFFKPNDIGMLEAHK